MGLALRSRTGDIYSCLQSRGDGAGLSWLGKHNLSDSEQAKAQTWPAHMWALPRHLVHLPFVGKCPQTADGSCQTEGFHGWPDSLSFAIPRQPV